MITSRAVGQHHQCCGQRLLECAVESRRVDRRIGFHRDPLQQMRVADWIERVGCALAAQSADAAELVVGEVEAVHRDMRNPAATLALADAGDELLDQRGLARARATGNAEDGTAVYS